MKFVSRIFLQGLMAVVPVGATIYILYWLGTTAEGVLKQIVPGEWYVSGMGVVFGIGIVFIIGLLLSAWFVRKLFEWGEAVLQHIPLVKTLYGSVRDLLSFFDSSKKDGFNQVVMVNFADRQARLIGLVTRDEFGDVPAGIGSDDSVAVYLPMSYQMGGFTVIVPKALIEPIDMSIEEAMRFALTAGMSTEKKD